MINRYFPQECEDVTGAILVESKIGIAVLHTDYEKLEKENLELKSRLNKMIDKYDELFDYALNCDGGNPVFMQAEFAIDFNPS